MSESSAWPAGEPIVKRVTRSDPVPPVSSVHRTCRVVVPSPLTRNLHFHEFEGGRGELETKGPFRRANSSCAFTCDSFAHSRRSGRIWSFAGRTCHSPTWNDDGQREVVPTGWLGPGPEMPANCFISAASIECVHSHSWLILASSTTRLLSRPPFIAAQRGGYATWIVNVQVG